MRRAASSFDLRCSPTHVDQARSLAVLEFKYIAHSTPGEIDAIDALGEFFREPYAHRSDGEQTICLARAAPSLVLLAATSTIWHLQKSAHVSHVAWHVGVCLTEPTTVREPPHSRATAPRRSIWLS